MRWQFECERRNLMGLFEWRLANMTFSFPFCAQRDLCQFTRTSNEWEIQFRPKQKQREHLKTNRSLQQINTK